MHMAKTLRHSDLQCEGINLFLADGEAAFQDVFHVHIHVFPRFQGDPFKIDANWEAKPSRQELDEIAQRIRRAQKFIYNAKLTFLLARDFCFSSFLTE